LWQILKQNAMEYVRVNEERATDKSIVDFLQSIPQVISFDFLKKNKKPKSAFYYELDHAFADVRLMLDGKKKEKSAQEFLEEMRKLKADELRNKND
jgi:hypothetical protein